MDKRQIADSILNLAKSLESDSIKEDIKIAVTNFGSELGEENVNQAIKSFKNSNFDVVVIGKPIEGFESYEASSDDEIAKKISELFDKEIIDACVTMHYPFPIGVSTVGKVITPAFGKEMYIATTTGTTDTNRVKAMILNAINGIIAAKANGIENPGIGILNVEAARIVEKNLKELSENGYAINFKESTRKDGGNVMRGNDLIAGTPDVMVCDSLTGNVLMKVFASYSSGGLYETQGFGYGPGIGKNYDKSVFIVSRASGTPVIKNAIQFAYESVKGKLAEISKKEYELAEKAGLQNILNSLDKKEENTEEIECPAQEIVTASIGGVDILEIENAVKLLWKEHIYAESAMGCTGPIIMISEKNLEKAKEVLIKNDLIS